MFYHIRIDYFDDKLKSIRTLVEFDYTEIKDIEDVAINYLSNQNVIFDGSVLESNSIKAIHVYSTNNDIRSERESYNQEHRGVAYFNDVDFLTDQDYCKNITRDILNNVKEKLEDPNKVSRKLIKKPMLFISHSSNDYDFVEALTDMLAHIGLTCENLFCSSIPGFWLHLSDDIFESLRKLFQDHDMFVIFVLSPHYYESTASLNEMGAAWVLQSQYCSILTKNMAYANMKGVLGNSKIAIKVDDQEAKFRLNDLKNRIFTFLKMDKDILDSTRWEHERDKFLKDVNK